MQIAQYDVQNQQLQIANGQAVEDFLRSKYTSQDLYGWMISQTSSVFFQCYQMAYDMAKRAEKAFRFERGLKDSSLIGFGYWDNLKKGLLSGEQLYLDLKRLEMAYLDQNKRDYEISKHISLVLTAPMALISLKETGQCTVDLPEALFDADYPGHFMRRVKSVSLTIPCVTGPYTSVNCTLTLLKNSTRVNGDLAGNEGNYTCDVNSDDPRFVDDFAATQSIATSTGQNDSGMLEVNFRDERYLMFEGAGAISTWQIDLPKDTNAFDFETISDVIINLNYTARDGGDALRQAARSAVVSQPPMAALRLFSLKYEFPTEWYKFLHPADTDVDQSLSILLTNERFPFQYRGKKITVSQAEFFLKFKDAYPPSVPATCNNPTTPLADYGSSRLPVCLAAPSMTGTPPSAPLQSSQTLWGGIPYASFKFSTAQQVGSSAWIMKVNGGDIQNLNSCLQTIITSGGTNYYHLNPGVIDDLIVVFHYSVA